VKPHERDRLLSLRWRITACVAFAGISTIAVVLVAQETAALNPSSQQPAGAQSGPAGDRFGNPLAPGSVSRGRSGRASAVSGGS
jgi:hypothetical protein